MTFGKNRGSIVTDDSNRISIEYRKSIVKNEDSPDFEKGLRNKKIISNVPSVNLNLVESESPEKKER